MNKAMESRKRSQLISMTPYARNRRITANFFRRENPRSHDMSHSFWKKASALRACGRHAAGMKKGAIGLLVLPVAGASTC
jgi:hypothetical protein